MRAIKICIWKTSRRMNRVQKRQNSKMKNIINTSWFPHLETRSLNHLLTRNLKILNLNGHLSECSSACIFGISTGIKKANLGDRSASNRFRKLQWRMSCYDSDMKPEASFTTLYSAAEKRDTAQWCWHLTSFKRVEVHSLAETSQFYLTRYICPYTYTHTPLMYTDLQVSRG